MKETTIEIKERDKINYYIGKYLMVFSILLYLVENIYFGFNITPQSSIERILDLVDVLILWVGFGLYMYPLIVIYEQMFKK